MNPDRPCSLCAHSMRTRRTEPYCGLSPAFYACAEERSMSWLQAIAYNACGRTGRFFVPIVSRVELHQAADGEGCAADGKAPTNTPDGFHARNRGDEVAGCR